MNYVLPICYNFTGHKYSIKECRPKGKRIIVSLTSFPKRIDKVWLTIESLFRQTIPPDLIVLWLSKEQFKDRTFLPTKLLLLEKRGLEIRLVDNDLRSYKKYYYAFQEFPDDVIILVDDDFFYNSDLIESLIESYNINPCSISARYGYVIRRDSLGDVLSYNRWSFFKFGQDCSQDLFFGSGGGTLVKRNMFCEDVMDMSLATRLCPTADDVFLNAMMRLAGTSLCFVKGTNLLASIIIPNNECLSTTNIGEDARNDIQISNINNYYKQLLGRVVF